MNQATGGDIDCNWRKPRKMERQQKVRRKADMESIGQWFLPPLAGERW